MTATLTHAVFRVSGEPAALAAYDARLKLLFAEHGIGDEVDEQHAAGSLHYDLKVAGGIPFPPFALASADFPELAVEVEWVDMVSGVRGAATIARGALTAQKTENVETAGAGYQVVIRAKRGTCQYTATFRRRHATQFVRVDTWGRTFESDVDARFIFFELQIGDDCHRFQVPWRQGNHFNL